MPRSPVEDRSVVVTGGAGFVGSHLADALVDRNEVTVVDGRHVIERRDGSTFEVLTW